MPVAGRAAQWYLRYTFILFLFYFLFCVKVPYSVQKFYTVSEALKFILYTALFFHNPYHRDDKIKAVIQKPCSHHQNIFGYLTRLDKKCQCIQHCSCQHNVYTQVPHHSDRCKIIKNSYWNICGWISFRKTRFASE